MRPSAPDDRRAHATRGAAVALLAVWAFLSGPALTNDIHLPNLPRGAVAAALVAALGLARPDVMRAVSRAIVRIPNHLFVRLYCAVCAGLSLWFWFGPMHGQAFADDACLHTAQGRALAHGALGIPLLLPRLASSAKFLLEGVDGRMHTVFVPGYPLFLAPFLAVGAPWAAGAFTSVLLALASRALGRAVSRDEFVTRAAMLLALPSFARVIETADLLSHALVAALAAWAMVAALRLRESPRVRDGAMLGVCLGWIFGARMLDGLVLGAVLAAGLAGPLLRRRIPWRVVAVALACALPFVGLTAMQQRAATGHVTRATSVEYAARADFPSNCLRLGFGRDVGCRVEHGPEVSLFGDDGYTPDDALRVVRERTARLGEEFFALCALTLLAFAGVALRPDGAALWSAAFPVALTLGYGLFYFGNAPIHGARHVFPASPFLLVLVTRALTLLPDAVRPKDRGDDGAPRGVWVLALLAMMTAMAPSTWEFGASLTDQIQRQRVPLRERMAAQGITRGIVVTSDFHSWMEALDPWADGDARMMVLDDGAGVQDVRRFHPELPVWLALPDGTLGRVGSPTPGPGLHVELERAWPSLQRVHGLGAHVALMEACCGLPASGGRALRLFEADPGDTVTVPFDLAFARAYRFRTVGYASYDLADWAIDVDGAPLSVWRGYAPTPRRIEGGWSSPVTLARGPHTITIRCVGRDVASQGWLGFFDYVEAVPVE